MSYINGLGNIFSRVQNVETATQQQANAISQVQGQASNAENTARDAASMANTAAGAVNNKLDKGAKVILRGKTGALKAANRTLSGNYDYVTNTSAEWSTGDTNAGHWILQQT
jgi:adenylosuccinate synthase